MLTDTTQSNYQVGQICNYLTRPQDVGSTVTILKIESHPKLGNIVHIQLQGLKIKNPQHESGFSTTISHLPISEAALDESRPILLQENTPLPDYEEGYTQWRQAFDAGKAGVFTIPLSQVLNAMETALNQ